MSARARASLIDPKDAEGILKLYFNSVKKFLNRIPNTRRIGAHSPMIAMLMLPFTAALQREGAGGVLSSKIKEMAIIKTSHLNGCKY